MIFSFVSSLPYRENISLNKGRFFMSGVQFQGLGLYEDLP